MLSCSQKGKQVSSRPWPSGSTLSFLASSSGGAGVARGGREADEMGEVGRLLVYHRTAATTSMLQARFQSCGSNA